MKLFSYIAKLFNKNKNGDFFTHADYDNYSKSKSKQSNWAKDFNANKNTKVELDSLEDSLNSSDLIEGISNKVNRDRVVDAIEAHKGTYPVFTTTMVYKWLLGNMPILSVRKCIYKLQAQGYLEHCKKTIATNKRVKYYSVKND